jgi:hypothetical protein
MVYLIAGLCIGSFLILNSLIEYRKRRCRNIKRLLKLMLRKKYYFETGLCTWGHNLYLHGVVSNPEHIRLEIFFRRNRPEGCYKSYWWPKGEIEPRIEWLKEQIKKL